MVGPLYVLIFRGELAVPTGVILPFFEPDDLQGFTINMIIQFVIGFIGFIAVLCIEVASSLIFNTFTVMADMVCFNMRTFSDRIRQGAFSHENEMELRNIIVQLEDLEEYFKVLNDIYYWKFFLQPILTTGCVSLAIFAQLVVSRIYSGAKYKLMSAKIDSIRNRTIGHPAMGLHRAYIFSCWCCAIWEMESNQR